MNNYVIPPSFVFISCYGSYFLGIFNALVTEKNKNDPLLFLMDYQLAYQKLDVQKLKKDNKSSKAWFYQPINFSPISCNEEKIGILDDIDFFSQKMSRLFSNDYNMTINNFSNLNPSNLLSLINKNISNKVPVAVAVDEFYNSSSPFYQKEHNNQGLLVIGFEEKEDAYRVINANDINSYVIGKDELLNGYSSKKTAKYIFTINGENFNIKVDYIKYMKKYFQYHHENNAFIDNLIHETTALLDDNENIEYKLNGLTALILSKIIPLLTTYQTLWERIYVILNDSICLNISNRFSNIIRTLKLYSAAFVDLADKYSLENHKKLLVKLSMIKENLIILDDTINTFRNFFYE